VRISDKGLAGRIVAGDRRAGAELLRRYAERGFGLAFRILGNREDAEEALQDAFIRVFRSLGGFEWKSSFATWFYRIVYNASVSAVGRRGAGARQYQEVAIEQEAHASIDAIPDRIVEGEEFTEIVRQEIGRMPEDHAVILTLFFLHEQSYDEIVEIMGLPLGTVKNRLFRARLKLREAVLAQYRTPAPMRADGVAGEHNAGYCVNSLNCLNSLNSLSCLDSCHQSVEK
jgi:RNA polymerase sigma factor (sigma-70 family)